MGCAGGRWQRSESRVARQRSPDIRKINPVIMESSDTFCAQRSFLSSLGVLLFWIPAEASGSRTPLWTPRSTGGLWGRGLRAGGEVGLRARDLGNRHSVDGKPSFSGEGDVGRGEFLIAGHILLVYHLVLANIGVFALHLSQSKRAPASPPAVGPRLDLHAGCIWRASAPCSQPRAGGGTR